MSTHVDVPVSHSYYMDVAAKLAGIINAERMDLEVKTKASTNLLKLMEMLEKELTELSLAKSGIQTQL